MTDCLWLQAVASTFVGVCWRKNGSQWEASLQGATKPHLGRFADEQDAARAYDKAARRLRPKGKAHGSEFTRMLVYM